MSSIKLILQSEKSDCAWACLSMILQFYGSQIPVAACKSQIATTLRGTSLADLVQASQKFSLQARVYYSEISHLATFPYPVILHWQSNHYVVLDKVDQHKGFHILDPACGQYWLTEKKFKSSFTGFVLSLLPNQDYHNQVITNSNHYWGFIKNVPGLFKHNIYIAVATVFIQLLALRFPLYLQHFFLAQPIAQSIILLSIFKLVEVTLQLLRAFAISKFEVNFLRTMSFTMLEHLYHLPYSFYLRQGNYSLYMRMLSLEKLRELLSRGFIEGLIDSVFAITVLFVVCSVSWRAGAILIVTSGLCLWIHSLLIARSYSYNQLQLHASHRANSFLFEILNAISTIKNFIPGSNLLLRWQNQTEQHLKYSRKISHLQALLDMSRNLLMGVQIVGLIILDIREFSIILVLLLYFNLFNKTMINASNKLFDCKWLRYHLGTFHEILDETIETQSTTYLTHISEMIFSHICFRYNKKENYLIEDLSLSLKAGQSLAIVGPSGCGKSTLLKIMMGLIPPSKGEIVINHYPLGTCLRSFRQLCGTVLQEDDIFSGTIYQNISLFADSPDLERIHELSALVELEADIHTLPMTYQTLLGEGGTNLSSGQKQRLLIARALYTKPQVLFLDEAFCHLDKPTEQLIQQRIHSLGVTRIVITHRQENLETYDHIIDIAKIR